MIPESRISVCYLSRHMHAVCSYGKDNMSTEQSLDKRQELL